MATDPDNLEMRKDFAPQFSDILNEEISLAEILAGSIAIDSRIGYEPSNQYLFVRNDLWEKVINCEHLKASGLCAVE